MTQILPSRRADGSLDDDAISAAAALLLAGDVVAIPTETVYGLGANALDARAVQRIYDAKGRPSHNPLIVHVPDVAAARALSLDWTPLAEQLAAAFWPGPLTLVVRKTKAIPDLVTAGLPFVGLRVPAHPVMLAVLRKAGVPIAAPSANRSNHVSPTLASHVARSLGDRVPLVLDDGACAVGIESTVVDVSGPLRLLRPGGVSASELERVAGPIERTSGEAALASPGQLARHYSPDAKTLFFEADLLGRLPREARVGVVAITLQRPEDHRVVAFEALGTTPEAAATRLFDALHRLEIAGVTHVLLEAPPAGTAWDAVRDRMKRAAG